MSLTSRCRTALLFIAVPTIATTTSAQVQQAASTVPAGTLALANLPAGASEAAFASIDARQTWSFMAAYEHANRALTLDSTFGFARVLRVNVGGAPTNALATAEYQRGTADAAARAVGEATYLSGLRATGVNANRILASARQMLPNDRRIALDHALSFISQDRIDSLRSLVRQYPDFVAPRIWLSYYLAFSPYSSSPGEIYDGLTVAEAAVRLAPKVASTHAALGWALRVNERLDEAAAHLAAATKMDPQNEVAFSTEAEIFVRDGKPRGVDRSRAALDSAIAASPNFLRRINYRRDKGFLLIYDGRKAEAMIELATVAKEYEAAGAQGTAAVVYSQMAGLAAGTGDSAAVEGYLVEARRVAPTADITIQSAQAYVLSRQPGAARRELAEFTRRATDTTTAAYKSNLRRVNGMILVAEGKPAEGLAELKRSDIPSNAFAELSMIDAFNAMNNKAEANALLAAVVARKNASNAGVSTAIANYRARKR